MSKIIADLQKKKENGFNVLDTDGKYLKEDNVKMLAMKDYTADVKSKEIDPLKVSFADYFATYAGDVLISVDEIIEVVQAVLDGKEIIIKDLPIEESETDETSGDTEAE